MRLGRFSRLLATSALLVALGLSLLAQSSEANQGGAEVSSADSFGDEIDDFDANRCVDGTGTPIGADQRELVMRRGRTDQGVVQRSATDS